jgi:transposase
MGPGRRCWLSCGGAAMRPRAGAGRWRWIRVQSGCISTRRGPAAHRHRTFGGAGANDTNPAAREALGRSRGGLTTKIHLAADLRCRPLPRVTTPGHRHDSTAFEQVIAGIAIARPGGGRPRTRPGHLLGDKAYSSRAIRSHLRRRGITATIPQPADQKAHRTRRGSRGGRPPAFDASRYKQRNTVERCLSKLKGHRAVATRYDKRDYVYRGTIDVASIRIWLRDPVP